MSVDPTGASTYASMAMDPAAASGLSDRDHASRMAPEEAIESFEGYLAQLMVREMRRTIPDGGLLSSRAADMFMDVLDQEIATRIAEGPGLGMREALADVLPGAEAGHAAHLAPEARPGRQWPARHPVDGVVTSRYGRRSDPFTDRHSMHDGVDIAARRGSPVRAVRDGTVVLAGQRSGYGNVVLVDHGDGLQTLYAHCERLDVREGATVRAGQRVGTVGDTGRATGPHLHFEVRVDGEAVDPDGALRWR